MVWGTGPTSFFCMLVSRCAAPLAKETIISLLKCLWLIPVISMLLRIHSVLTMLACFSAWKGQYTLIKHLINHPPTHTHMLRVFLLILTHLFWIRSLQTCFSRVQIQCLWFIACISTWQTFPSSLNCYCECFICFSQSIVLLD